MSQSIMLLQEQSAEPDASGMEVGSPKDGDTSVANAGDGAAACVAAGSLTLFRGHACFKCSADDLAAAAAAAGGKVQLKLSEPVGAELEVALTVQEAPMQVGVMVFGGCERQAIMYAANSRWVSCQLICCSIKQ
jgi:hypothetical protein